MKDIIKSIEDAQLKPEVDSFRVGDTVRVSAKVVEGSRERIQVFEGTVIKRQNGGAKETFTVRKFSNGVGVEKTWPLHSPIVTKIQVVRKGKVRRAKLYYLRDRIGKRAKVKELVKISRWEGTSTSVLSLFVYVLGCWSGEPYGSDIPGFLVQTIPMSLLNQKSYSPEGSTIS